METPRKGKQLSFGAQTVLRQNQKKQRETKIYHFCTCNASFQKALAMFRFHLSKIYKSIN